MIDIAAIATGLTREEGGIWFAGGAEPFSYPREGHAECRQMEDDSFWFRHRGRCIEAVVRRYPPGGPVFDVGGGNGYVAATLAAAGIETVLVEPGLEGVMNARARGVRPLVCATLADAGFLPHTIPAIGIFDVLEHVRDDAGFLNTLRGLLAPGGRLYVTVPAYPVLWSVEDVGSGHFRRYRLGTLVSRLEAAGFGVEFGSYLFRFLPPAVFLFRTVPTWLGRRKAREFRRNEREHRRRGGPVGRMMDRLLEREYRAITRGRPIRFGGSCLVVARHDPREGAHLPVAERAG